MSLAKLSVSRYVPGAPANPGRPYSITCPSDPPYPSPDAGTSTGGVIGGNCYRVPVYADVIYDPTTGAISHTIVGYTVVCYG